VLGPSPVCAERQRRHQKHRLVKATVLLAALILVMAGAAARGDRYLVWIGLVLWAVATLGGKHFCYLRSCPVLPVSPPTEGMIMHDTDTDTAGPAGHNRVTRR
jgi:hypothetical protein